MGPKGGSGSAGEWLTYPLSPNLVAPIRVMGRLCGMCPLENPGSMSNVSGNVLMSTSVPSDELVGERELLDDSATEKTTNSKITNWS
jgi:hypothetical protein